jgi:CRISPR/Cas system CSM-associated protein Csm3 (group 7 of RAMP superfamily)
MPLQVKIDLTVMFEAPFNVGTGAMAGLPTDRPTILNGRNRPYVPGSSLKGRLRHRCEQLLRTITADPYAACHSPAPDRMCPLDEHWLGQFCPICRLFGSPHRAGPLFFGDLQWMTADIVEAETAVRRHVSINRRRRVAEQQRLFDVEVFAPEPRTELSGLIHGSLPYDDSQALVALLLGGLNLMNSLGGGRSAGLGACSFSPHCSIDEEAVDEKWIKEGLSQWRV